MHGDSDLSLNLPRRVKRYRIGLLLVTLIGALSLAGCADTAADRDSAIQGRWHRVDGTHVDDPFQTLAGE
jgi:hypothetical protein